MGDWLHRYARNINEFVATITTGAAPHLSDPAAQISQSVPTDTSHGDFP